MRSVDLIPVRALAFVALTASTALLGACAALQAPSVPSKPAAAATPPAQPGTLPLGVSPVARSASGPTGVAVVAAAPPAQAQPPGGPPPFAKVIAEASKIEGPLTLWQKDDKVWIELAPTDFGRPFLLSPKLSSGIGQSFILGGLMLYPMSGAGGQQVVEFSQVHKQVRLLALNHEVAAAAGTPEARALASSFSPSLLGSVPVVSQPHPTSKAVLIEANGLFLGDMQGVGMRLQRAFRQGYVLDVRNSVISGVRASPQSVEIETQNHYYAASIGVAQPALPGAPQPPAGLAPSVPKYVPDARSFFIGHHYSLAPMPATMMAPRKADPRVGLFTSTVLDFSDDLARTPRQRYITRWRLEKKDPAAALSEPVKPITFWIDRNVPQKYRATIGAGIVEWNRAFEKIGFKDAIVVKQQADDAAFDTLDVGYASVRWMMSAEPSFGAIGLKHVDPRSGEILDADIGIESLSSRSVRTLRSQTLPTTSFADVVGGASSEHGAADNAGHDFCVHGDLMAEQLGYALDVFEARGDLDPNSPQAQQFVLDYLKDVTMHEVGHTLGLRHNFRASRAYTEEQLGDAEFTRTHGTTGSVMEYNAINLPRPGQAGGSAFQTVLGPYDYWAIEYAYRPLAPADEKAELLKIASRGNEPLLAFGTDEDASFGIDPETLRLDLGSDPIAYAAKRLDIARDLFARQEVRQLSADDSYAVLRRSLAYAIADSGRAAGVLVRQIGGVRTLRDFPGSGRDPLQPVDADTQRRALELLSRHVLSTGGLTVSPALQRRLAPDFEDRVEIPGLSTDYPVPQRLFDLQRAVLAQLMSDDVAARILDSVGKTDRPETAFQLSELYARLNQDVWSELAGTGNGHISVPRRDLQREYVNRLAASLLRPSPQSRADTRGLLRVQAQALAQQLNKAAKRTPASEAATRAHLQDSADTLNQA
ncbi:MAG: zinc-dependent metalloprotease, partial [Rubrivivax sp.]